jgi:nucleotide-binding universal stress UspA family protein
MAEPLIIVPLDGSELSEGAIPYAVTLARATGARLALVTIWEEANEALVARMPELADDLFKRGEQHYERYLKDVAKRIESGGVRVEAQVLAGDAAEQIERLAEDRGARFVVIASHGRAGLSRWVYGSVASTLVQTCEVPLLVVGPKALESGPDAGTIRRILVPLDGSELGELALAPALELAEALRADLILAQVLKFATQAFAFEVPAVEIQRIDEELTAAAESYLAQKRDALRTKRSVTTKVEHGLPADALTELVDDEKIDLIVMATHARGGIARVALGSLADRMVQSSAPVLLIRPKTPA